MALSSDLTAGRLLASAVLITLAAGCGDALPPPREVHLESLTGKGRIVADSLADILTRRFLAAPDTIANNPREFRVTFVHAPFASWSEPGCRGTHGSTELAEPIARVIWETMREHVEIRRITLVARDPVQKYRSLFRGVSCGGGVTEIHFHPHEFRVPNVTATKECEENSAAGA